MPDWLTHWLTTLKDRATQLLIKYKSGALVTQIVDSDVNFDQNCWNVVKLMISCQSPKNGNSFGLQCHQSIIHSVKLEGEELLGQLRKVMNFARVGLLCWLGIFPMIPIFFVPTWGCIYSVAVLEVLLLPCGPSEGRLEHSPQPVQNHIQCPSHKFAVNEKKILKAEISWFVLWCSTRKGILHTPILSKI